MGNIIKNFNFKENKSIMFMLISGIIIAFIVSACTFTNSKEEDDLSYLPSMEDINKNIEKNKNEDEEMVEVEVNDDESEKMVAINIDSYGRSNPFLPASESITDTMRYGFDLMAPPDALSTESDGAKVVTTKISGIMWDAKAPSAILNIEGSDYLVKAGDYINKYKILSVGKNIVTVQLGANVYKAQVGDVIADGVLNHNTIYNLDKKFGGSKK